MSMVKMEVKGDHVRITHDNDRVDVSMMRRVDTTAFALESLWVLGNAPEAMAESVMSTAELFHHGMKADNDAGALLVSIFTLPVLKDDAIHSAGFFILNAVSKEVFLLYSPKLVDANTIPGSEVYTLTPEELGEMLNAEDETAH